MLNRVDPFKIKEELRKKQKIVKYYLIKELNEGVL